MIKYEAQIVAIGEMVSEFLAHDIIVLFGENAPSELAEFSILHDGNVLHAPIAPGDTVALDDVTLRILAVGEVANTNLANLGHLVLKLNGEDTVEMPGDVCVEKKPVPPLRIGTQIRVEGE